MFTAFRSLDRYFGIGEVLEFDIDPSPYSTFWDTSHRKHIMNNNYTNVCAIPDLGDNGILGIQVRIPQLQKVILQYRENDIFPAGSVIKISVLVELYRQIMDEGLDPHSVYQVADEFRVEGSGILHGLSDLVSLTLLDLAKLMIQVSDNTATNLLIYVLGREKINNFMQHLGLKNTCLLQDRISTESLNPLTSFAITTPSEMADIFSHLANESILNPNACKNILKMLKRSTNKNRICALLPYRSDITIHHKTGTLEGVYNDVGLIRFSHGGFIVSAFTKGVVASDDPRTPNRAENLIAQITAQIFEQIDHE